MAKDIRKYNGSGTHRRAVLHAIGQLVEINFNGATIAEVARFMNVSKVTAKKYLDILENNNEVIRVVSDYKSNSVMFRYFLAHDILDEYIGSVFVNDYRLYCQQVLKVVLLGKS